MYCPDNSCPAVATRLRARPQRLNTPSSSRTSRWWRDGSRTLPGSISAVRSSSAARFPSIQSDDPVAAADRREGRGEAPADHHRGWQEDSHHHGAQPRQGHCRHHHPAEGHPATDSRAWPGLQIPRKGTVAVRPVDFLRCMIRISL